MPRETCNFTKCLYLAYLNFRNCFWTWSCQVLLKNKLINENDRRTYKILFYLKCYIAFVPWLYQSCLQAMCLSSWFSSRNVKNALLVALLPCLFGVKTLEEVFILRCNWRHVTGSPPKNSDVCWHSAVNVMPNFRSWTQTSLVKSISFLFPVPPACFY